MGSKEIKNEEAIQLIQGIKTGDKALDMELSDALSTIIINHKKRFIDTQKIRYKEIMPVLIGYENAIDTIGDTKIRINTVKMEVMLRNNYRPVIGENKQGTWVLLGYLQSFFYKENLENFFIVDKIDKKDVHFIISDELIPDELEELTFENGAETGNCVVLQNKVINMQSDYNFIDHYIDEMAEIEISRYSIVMQARINTFLTGDRNDQTVNEVIRAIYNGDPFTKVTGEFDPRDRLYAHQNTAIGSMLTELKREKQNKVSELNNTIGIQSLGVEKSSGVNEVEAKSNQAWTNSNANIYILGRQTPFDLLNIKTGGRIRAVYNDVVAGQFIEQQKKEDETDETDDNTL